MRFALGGRRGRARNPLGAVAVLVAIALVAGLVSLLQPPEKPLSGTATAIDGDTLRLAGQRVRLTGLDAVERAQTCAVDGRDWPCGEAAHAFLAAAVGGTTTTCTPAGHDRYGRVLATCTAGGRDLGDALVRAGWAVADPGYALALAEARLARRGIWAGRFDDPADWRRRHDAGEDDFWGWLRSLVAR